MASNDLNIIIRAAIDPNQKTDDLQTSIDNISKKLKFNIGIDTNQFQQLTNQVQSIQKIISGLSAKGIKIIDNEEFNNLKKADKDIQDSINDIKLKYKDLGQVKFTQNIDEATGRLKNFIVELERTKGVVEKFTYNPLNISTTGDDFVTKFMLSTQKITDDRMKAEKQVSDLWGKNLKNQELEQQKSEDKLQQTKLKNLQAVAEERKKLREQYFQILNSNDPSLNSRTSAVQNLGSLINSAKTTEDLNSAKQQLENIKQIQSEINAQVKKEGQDRLKNYQDSLKLMDQIHKQALSANKSYDQNVNTKTDLLTSVAQAHASYHGNIDTSALKDLVQRIKDINPASETAQRDLQKLQQELRQLKVDASETANSITGKLKHAIESMALWAVGGGAFFAGVNALRDSIKSYADIERQMAGVIQVLPDLHGNQEKVNEVTNEFISIAEKYGQSIDDVIQAGKLWGRQYKDVNEVMQLVNSTTLLSIVDNLSLADANKTLEAAMNQYGMVAQNSAQAFEFSRKIIDSWSNVAHNAMVKLLAV